jgi:short-subunit dehydrogenase
MKVENKIIVVTGAGSGIGRELAIQLLRKNTKVAGIDIHPDTLAETQSIARVGDDMFKGFVADISDKALVESLPEKIIGHFGAVDGIINNAGIIQKFIKISELSYEDINRVMNINFYGTVYMTKAFLPYLLSRPEAHIVNISSMGGFLPVPGQTIYGSAKAAVKLFTEGLYAELADTKVRVTIIFPGAIATNITANSGIDMANLSSEKAKKYKTMPAEEAAKKIIAAMASNQFRATVGSDARFMDILYRISPKYAAGLIQKQMASLLK